jgi:hypothetical protein
MNDFTKQPQQLPTKYLNQDSYGGMSVVGGQISSVPTGVVASQGIQDLPGDRLILDQAGADALTDPAGAQLYGGVYQYVLTRDGSTASPGIGRLAFWLNPVPDPGDYEVTPDETSPNGYPAGVYIITQTQGYYWWIQIAGLADIRSISTLAVATLGAGAYAAMAGAGANVGTFTQFTGAYSNATNEEVDQMNIRFLGQAVELPVAGTNTLVNMPLHNIRW